MVAISMRFPAGRFHATPWGRHVNEGAPEWPPSPWRILRSLVAVWKRKLSEQAEENDVQALLTRLIAPPRFVLPAATAGHTRHYMPWFKTGPAAKTKVFDSFVALRRSDEVVAIWPDAYLDERQASLLSMLLSHLGWLGRAESWCEATVLAESLAATLEPNCIPIDSSATESGVEPVRVLCADLAGAFHNEHTPKLIRTEGTGRKKQTFKTALYEPDWHLCLETAALHEQRWSDPPGSRWITYGRSPDCFKIDYARRTRRGANHSRFQVARYAMDSTVLPLLQETLRIAEWARRPLLRTPTFFGKDQDGRPAKGHAHAYYLPTDEDGDGRLDHLMIVSETPFSAEELHAIDRLQLKPAHWEEHPSSPIRLVLTGLFAFDEPPNALRDATTWVSATPFLVPRHPKRRGRKKDPIELLSSPTAFTEAALRQEIQRLMERRGSHFTLEKIDPLVDRNGAFCIRPRTWNSLAGERSLRPLEFRRFRQKHGDDGGRRLAGAFKIVFSEPVRGPICLGHSSHFGMGLFLPAAENPPQ